MMSYEIKDLWVWPRNFTDKLGIKVILKVPSGATVKNPDNTVGPQFVKDAPGVHVGLDFNVSGGDIANFMEVERKGVLHSVTPAGAAHRTTVNLKVNGTLKDNKTKTQAQYEEDPEFIGLGDK